MNALAHQLHEIAIVLENEATFHKMYNACAGESYARARTAIAEYAKQYARHPAAVLNSDRPDGAANREHLRRYFDDIYDVHGRVGTPGFPNLPALEFWCDKVRSADAPKSKALNLSLPCAGDKFDSSFASRDHQRRARHGMIWDDAELDKLCALSSKGLSLESLCIELQRPADGVINKLKQRRMITTDLAPGGYPVYHYAKGIECWQASASTGALTVDLKTMRTEIEDHINRANKHFSKAEAIAAELQEFSPPTPEKELPIMNAKTAIIEVTTKTLINGIDIKEYSDAQVYQLIADQEAEIDRLSTIKAKPKKLVAEIEKRQAGIAALVAYLDSKE